MTWRSRTWSGARSSGPSLTLAPAAISSRSRERISDWGKKSLAALAAPSTSPSSTTKRTSPTRNPIRRTTSSCRRASPSPSSEEGIADWIQSSDYAKDDCSDMRKDLTFAGLL
ncbi:uncharacterized protein A4U43_C08F22920 [Asparagus officinalis]|nr:uncharacterized protein A4U43_C08F22920 [Asparagus officinalis]